MNPELITRIANFNRSLFDRLSNAVTPRGIVDAFCNSLVRELDIPFAAGWVEGSDQFLSCSRDENSWIRSSHLPGKWIEASATGTRFTARPAIEIDKGSPPDIEVILEPVALASGGFEATFLVPPEYVELIKSQKSLIPLFQASTARSHRKDSSCSKAYCLESEGAGAHETMASIEVQDTLEKSLAVAERQIAEKSVLFIISEIFGSTLPLEVKMSSSIEIFKSFLEVPFVVATMIIDGERVIRLAGEARGGDSGDREWLDWFFGRYGNEIVESRDVAVISSSDWNSSVPGGFSYMVIPLRHGDRHLGSFGLPWNRSGEETSEEERDFLKAYAGIYTQGILVAESVSKLTKMRNFNMNILESIGSGVITFDREGVITLANSAAKVILGCEEIDITGLKADAISGFERAAEVIMQTQTGSGEVVSFEVPFGAEGRSDSTLGLSTSILRGSDGVAFGVCCIFRDLTRIKQMERRLIQNEKLVALGELAARVAHEIKNPLTTIRGFLELIQCEIERDAESYEYIDLVFKEVDYLVDSLDDLLSFTRETEAAEEYRFAETDINQFVTDVIYFEKSCKHLKKIDIDRRLGKALPLCLVERGKLKRAISNILLNSGQALAYAGTANPVIRISTHAAEDWVSIRITDNGPGISKNIRDRVLSPFFTTKSRGTGLGLAICERIMRKMGGTMTFRSLVGKGTCFELRVQALAAGCS